MQTLPGCVAVSCHLFPRRHWLVITFSVVIASAGFAMTPAFAHSLVNTHCEAMNDDIKRSLQDGYTMPGTCILEPELANVCALPYGFIASCERAQLKFRSNSSATFKIRNSCLCERMAFQFPNAQREFFTLCSNDPSHSSEPSRHVAPKCVDLRIEEQEV